MLDFTARYLQRLVVTLETWRVTNYSDNLGEPVFSYSKWKKTSVGSISSSEIRYKVNSLCCFSPPHWWPESHKVNIWTRNLPPTCWVCMQYRCGMTSIHLQAIKITTLLVFYQCGRLFGQFYYISVCLTSSLQLKAWWHANKTDY